MQKLRIAVIGNPNSGKTSVFNLLTGLQQKVGNFPGVTVDRKSGIIPLGHGQEIELVDFPGAYSLYPTSKDERLVVQTLCNPGDPDYPDGILYIADVTRLEKHLLLLTQVKDLGLPTILALNMSDLASGEGLEIDTTKLSRKLGVAVVSISGRSGQGMDALRDAIGQTFSAPATELPPAAEHAFYRPAQEEARIATELQEEFPLFNPYQRILLAHHYQWLPFLAEAQRARVGKAVDRTGFRDLPLQVRETMQRFDNFTPIVSQCILRPKEENNTLTERVDNILTHRVAGPFIFFALMLLLFQALFSWATFPMDFIEGAFSELGVWVRNTLPAGWFTDLLTDGLLAGLSGILVFVPQIAILFFLISLLEEVGYMARVAFLFDRLMQFFGLNGRSIVSLISGGACAIPAIMSTRTISNWRERLITILVTPFISCSARIPVYTVLIGFVVPPQQVLGVFNLQGLAFMGLYLLGIMSALLAALVFKLILRTNETSYLMLELPAYRFPLFRNVWMTVWEKVKTFSLEAGKIILIISLVLWVLSSYGPSKQMQQAIRDAEQIATAQQLGEDAREDLIAAKKMEASFAGIIGRSIEPVIKPLGFDWKIGIALITSFAAREVFVGTMATIYSIGHEEDNLRIRERMANERDPVTGEKIYSMPTALALLLFYVFAMQCMSTLAIVGRETRSWKWPLIQFTFMTGLAYLSGLLAYQVLS